LQCSIIIERILGAINFRLSCTDCGVPFREAREENARMSDQNWLVNVLRLSLRLGVN
jgi:hypothetical protein